MREKLIALSIVKKGNWGEIYQVLRNDKKLHTIDEYASYELIKQLDCDMLTLMDDEYPLAWREMRKPPFVVFYKGDIELLKSKAVSVIGGKVKSSYTSKAISNLMRALPRDINVISGLEIGVEAYSISHASIKIAVIASGFIATKQPTQQVDLILSELPPNVKFNLSAYYRSYHLIHELSDIVCVFELPSFDLRLKYLAYLTEIGKEVVVAPDVFKKSTSGGLGLINHGAKLMLGSKDIVKLLVG